jgi:hypothetical protein
MVEDNGSDVLLDAEDSWSNCDGWNEGSVKFNCVLCTSEMETVKGCFAHCSSAHSFDFKHIRNLLGSKFINSRVGFLWLYEAR